MNYRLPVLLRDRDEQAPYGACFDDGIDMIGKQAPNGACLGNYRGYFYATGMNKLHMELVSMMGSIRLANKLHMELI
ncbi:MAG: hypothetical protein ACE3L7_10515 [Candidatus Pristimantibacillus sp.]